MPPTRLRLSLGVRSDCLAMKLEAAGHNYEQGMVISHRSKCFLA